MASSISNKYAGLPDIELDQQDVYETPDIPDDVSTIPTSLSDDDDENIERQGFSIEAARRRFADERVDAEYADFSDTLIARKRKQSYRTSRQEIESHEETFEQKMARVRQEVEEIRLQMAEEKRPEAEVAEWETLIQAVSNENNSATILTSRLQKLSSSSTSRAAITNTYTLQYSPSETTQLSGLSTRLSSLESLLGLPLTSINSSPILPSISHLSSKLNLLTSHTNIDALTQRMKSLTADLEKLEEKREQARQRALLDSEDSPLVIETDETARKIDALYALLETIDKVAPVVPGILDRLRGMSIVHADAAGVATGLKEVEVRIGSVQREIKEWNEALERVESEMRESGERVNGMANRVEKVVSDLEDQVKKLEL